MKKQLLLSVASIPLLTVASVAVTFPYAGTIAMGLVGVMGLWAGVLIARNTRVQEMYATAMTAQIPTELSDDLSKSQHRTKRTWRGARTDESVERGAIGSLFALVAAGFGYAWSRHRWVTIAVVVLALAWLALQLSPVAGVVAARSLIAVWVFAAGVSTVSELVGRKP